MKILLAGSSGFIGKELTDLFQREGHTVTSLKRERSPNSIYWNPEKEEIEIEKLEGFDVVICLNGVNIMKKRWNSSFKKQLLDSRVLPARFLTKSLSILKNPPKVYFQASGSGYYGNVSNPVDESFPKGNLYLSEVCEKWEAVASCLDPSIRRVFMRFGMVLGKNGGALSKMIPMFRAYLGAVMGRKDILISWISAEDIYGALCHLVKHQEIEGAVNFVSPEVLPAGRFYKSIGRWLKRPCLIVVPPFVIKLLFGQMGEELFLSNSNVIPKKLLDSNFQFRHAKIEVFLNQNQ